MPSWDQPNNSQPAHVDLLDQVRDRDTYAATWTQAGGSWSDLPIGLMQWDNGQNVIRRFNGTSFEVQQIGIAGGGTGASTAAGARVALDVYSKADTYSKAETLAAGTGGDQVRNNTQADTQTNSIIDSRKSDSTTLNDSTKLATSAAVFNTFQPPRRELVYTGSTTILNMEAITGGFIPGFYEVGYEFTSQREYFFTIYLRPVAGEDRVVNVVSATTSAFGSDSYTEAILLDDEFSGPQLSVSRRFADGDPASTLEPILNVWRLG